MGINGSMARMGNVTRTAATTTLAQPEYGWFELWTMLFGFRPFHTCSILVISVWTSFQSLAQKLITY